MWVQTLAPSLCVWYWQIALTTQVSAIALNWGVDIYSTDLFKGIWDSSEIQRLVNSEV